MIRKLALIVALLGLLDTGATALAEKIGPNGGLVAGAGSHQTELVVSATELTVYLLEEGRLHPAKGTKLRAIVQERGNARSINFVDEDGNRLVAKLPAPLSKGAILVLIGKDAHGDQFNSRYVIK